MDLHSSFRQCELSLVWEAAIWLTGFLLLVFLLELARWA
jgi:hypothetical protein